MRGEVEHTSVKGSSGAFDVLLVFRVNLAVQGLRILEERRGIRGNRDTILLSLSRYIIIGSRY